MDNLSLAVYVTMAAILKDLLVKDMIGLQNMRIKKISTSMGIAITILIAGFTVQITDNLGVFGKNSYIPLIIGLSIIAVGVVFFLLLRLITKNRSEKRNISDS
jgi:Trk-type K+ transport system membrane component